MCVYFNCSFEKLQFNIFVLWFRKSRISFLQGPWQEKENYLDNKREFFTYIFWQPILCFIHINNVFDIYAIYLTHISHLYVNIKQIEVIYLIHLIRIFPLFLNTGINKHNSSSDLLSYFLILFGNKSRFWSPNCAKLFGRTSRHL